MQLGIGSKNTDVATTKQPTWRKSIIDGAKTVRHWFQPRNGLNHKALMRQDWTAKAEKYFLLGGVLAFAAMPEFANADVDFSPLTNLIKQTVNFLIFDLGYYLGIAAIAIQGMRAKSGRIEWSTFFWTCAGVFIVFFAPNFVTQIKNGAATSI